MLSDLQELQNVECQSKRGGGERRKPKKEKSELICSRCPYCLFPGEKHDCFASTLDRSRPTRMSTYIVAICCWAYLSVLCATHAFQLITQAATVGLFLPLSKYIYFPLLFPWVYFGYKSVYRGGKAETLQKLLDSQLPLSLTFDLLDGGDGSPTTSRELQFIPLHVKREQIHDHLHR